MGMSEAYEAFSKIIFQNLEKVLEKRPANPVRKFVSNILEEIGLDERGDALKKKKKKDKKDKDKKKDDKDEDKKKDKKEKKDKDDKDKKEKKDKKKKDD